MFRFIWAYLSVLRETYHSCCFHPAKPFHFLSGQLLFIAFIHYFILLKISLIFLDLQGI